MAMFRQFDDEAGVAMIEALIAIVVISFGLLGLAGLQLAGVRTNQVAYYRSVATAQAYDMADRMRANISGVNGGSYNDITSPIPARPACSSCLLLRLLRTRLSLQRAGVLRRKWRLTTSYAWLTENARLLPGGSGTVTKNRNLQRLRHQRAMDGEMLSR